MVRFELTKLSASQMQPGNLTPEHLVLVGKDRVELSSRNYQFLVLTVKLHPNIRALGQIRTDVSLRNRFTRPVQSTTMRRGQITTLRQVVSQVFILRSKTNVYSHEPTFLSSLLARNEYSIQEFLIESSLHKLCGVARSYLTLLTFHDKGY